MKYFRQTLMAIAVVLSLSFIVSPFVLAVDSEPKVIDPTGEINKAVKDSGGGTPGDAALKKNIKTIVDVLLFAVGAIAVIVIVIGGLRYVVSGGDSNQIASAKNTILYAIIGLIVAILAYAIVNWIIGTFK